MRIHHRNYEYYSEDMCPVFDSPFATAEESDRVFKEGLVSLAQAMDNWPYFGEGPTSAELHLFGQFWEVRIETWNAGFILRGGDKVTRYTRKRHGCSVCIESEHTSQALISLKIEYKLLL